MSTKDVGSVETRIVPRADHPISRSAMSQNAVKVLYRLRRSGFQSFLVGGAVRDLLLGRVPKDFDIGTNARPQQVRHLFRNARVIGRRFRLVLISFSDETVEVATFRRSHEPPEVEEGEAVDVLATPVEVEEFGTPQEDAWRRDFTVNGIFYNVADFSVIDYVGGLADLRRGIIRSIGPARERFDEDPVRMMRALEYAARLGFALDEDAAEAIDEMHPEIRRANPARMAYELVESLKGGHSREIFHGLDRTGLLKHILPEVLSERANDSNLLWSLLTSADAANKGGEPLVDETLIGLLLLARYAPTLLTGENTAVSFAEREDFARDLWEGVCQRLMFSNFRSHILRTSFNFLGRIFKEPRSARLVVRTLRHEAYAVAYQLARILAASDERFRPGMERWNSTVARVHAGLPPQESSPVGRVGKNRRRRRGGKRQQRPVKTEQSVVAP